jgi:Flagellar hook-length control protein FliK
MNRIALLKMSHEAAQQQKRAVCGETSPKKGFQSLLEDRQSFPEKLANQSCAHTSVVVAPMEGRSFAPRPVAVTAGGALILSSELPEPLRGALKEVTGDTEDSSAVEAEFEYEPTVHAMPAFEVPVAYVMDGPALPRQLESAVRRPAVNSHAGFHAAAILQKLASGQEAGTSETEPDAIIGLSDAGLDNLADAILEEDLRASNESSPNSHASAPGEVMPITLHADVLPDAIIPAEDLHPLRPTLMTGLTALSATERPADGQDSRDLVTQPEQTGGALPGPDLILPFSKAAARQLPASFGRPKAESGAEAPHIGDSSGPTRLTLLTPEVAAVQAMPQISASDAAAHAAAMPVASPAMAVESRALPQMHVSEAGTRRTPAEKKGADLSAVKGGGQTGLAPLTGTERHGGRPELHAREPWAALTANAPANAAPATEPAGDVIAMRADVNPLQPLASNGQSIVSLVARLAAEQAEPRFFLSGAEEVKTGLQGRLKSIRIKLQPEHLGQVSIHVHSLHTGLRVEVRVENEDAGKALLSEIDGIASALSGMGLAVEQLMLTAPRGSLAVAHGPTPGTCNTALDGRSGNFQERQAEKGAPNPSGRRRQEAQEMAGSEPLGIYI